MDLGSETNIILLRIGVMRKLIENPDVAAVALASLVKMVRLLGAELVVGSHNDDINLLESAVRAKLFASVDGVSSPDTAAGVARAHRLVEPVLRELRARAEAVGREAARRENESPETTAEKEDVVRKGAAIRLN